MLKWWWKDGENQNLENDNNKKNNRKDFSTLKRPGLLSAYFPIIVMHSKVEGKSPPRKIALNRAKIQILIISSKINIFDEIFFVDLEISSSFDLAQKTMG